MNWEAISGVTGVVSAICAVISTIYLAREKRDTVSEVANIKNSTFSRHNLMAFLLAFSGWALACLCGLWVFEPFGPFVTDSDYRKFYGVVLAFPAFVTFMAGTDLLMNRKGT